jgi:hypothetical protein
MTRAFAKPTLWPISLGVATLVGCTGSIGDYSVESDPGSPTGTVDGTGPGLTASTANSCTGAIDPGNVTLHRLNNTEYDNTVRDLLGDVSQPAKAFPADSVASGFDNEASVLSMSPLLAEKYSNSAKTLVDSLLAGAKRSQVMTCDPATGGDACVQRVLSDFAKKAWRSPATPADVTRLVTLAKSAVMLGGAIEEGIRAALRSILLSPKFLFRVELDPSPGATTPHALGSYELASRLSYFLWSSAPDAELMTKADQNQLTSKEAVAAEVTRMLKDSKAIAVTDNFAGQWAGLRAMDAVAPDATVFPAFAADPMLRTDMKAEGSMFFGSFLTENKSALELLTSSTTYLNNRLAKWYGLAAPGSDTLKPSSTGAQRLGMLMQGSWLTGTSKVNRTFPTRRGASVLGQLFCEEPPPPPPMVPALADKTSTGSQSVRDRLLQHAGNPCAAACHTLTDPIGLAFENFDAVGRFRTVDAGFAVDPSGKLKDGTTFRDAKDLVGILANDPRYPRCFTSKTTTRARSRSSTRSSCSKATTWSISSRRLHRATRSRCGVVKVNEERPMKRLSLSRRTFLRSAGGIAIGLPLLEQMMPREAKAQAAASPKRFVGVFCPNGFIETDVRYKGAAFGDFRGYWTPATTGAGYVVTPTLQPLAALQNDFLFISGLDYTLGSSDHKQTSCFLTGGQVDYGTNSGLDKRLMNQSIDQQIADVIGKTTKKSSVQLLVNTTPNGDVLYTCVSWRDAVSPQATEHNPKALFDSFFAGFTPTSGSGPSPDQVRAAALEKSILDFVSTDASQLKMRLGKNDNVKLDQYLDGIGRSRKSCRRPPAPWAAIRARGPR